jgi:hypothetical protein
MAVSSTVADTSGQAILNAVTMYERFCEDVSVDTVRHCDNMRTMVVLFQKNVSTRDAYREIFPSDPFLDWSQTDQLRHCKIYKDTGAWIAMMQYFTTKSDEVEWRLFVSKHHVFQHFVASLTAAKLDLTTPLAVQLFLLLNTNNLTVQHAIELFFSVHFNRSVASEALQFFSRLADGQFDRRERTAVVVALLTSFVSMQHEVFRAEIELVRNQRSHLDAIFRQKHLQAASLRPQLRSRLKNKSLQGSALTNLDDFKQWSDSIRFPNMFSIMSRKRLYYTMSQVHVDRQHYITRFVQEDDLAQTILQYAVKRPDVEVLIDTITESRITAEPFAELHLFRDRCFNSFSLQQKAKLRLNDLLHLYIAAYQAECTWKQVWKSLFPVLSTQIIRDVESFVVATPFNHAQVMQIVFASGVVAQPHLTHPHPSTPTLPLPPPLAATQPPPPPPSPPRSPPPSPPPSPPRSPPRSPPPSPPRSPPPDGLENILAEWVGAGSMLVDAADWPSAAAIPPLNEGARAETPRS